MTRAYSATFGAVSSPASRASITARRSSSAVIRASAASWPSRAFAAISAIASYSSRRTRSSARIASSMPGPDDRFRLLAQTGQRGDRAPGHAGEVVEEARTVAH